jgi:arylsulfatase A-like enzyme
MTAMRRAVAAAVMLAAASLSQLPVRSVAAPPRPPNVLIIVTDDQRSDSLQSMPATTSLIRDRGTTFGKAFATTPLCCPSRASILTGRYAHNHGVRTGDVANRPAMEDLESSMIHRHLKDAGYSTALFGKYLNNWDLTRSPENLDEWAIFSSSGRGGYRSGMWNVDGTLQQVLPYSTNYISDRALHYVLDQESDDDRPWFVYLAPAAAHSPFDAEKKYRDETFDGWSWNPAVTEQDRSDKPLWVQGKSFGPYQAAARRTKQLRTLMSVDDLVQDVVGGLDRLGETGETLIVFTSDNGYMWGEHGLTEKRWPYLPSVQVPLVASLPGEFEPGRMDFRLVANIDIAPTIAELAGITLPGADGRSLLEDHHRQRLLLEYFRPAKFRSPPEWAATITYDYQYIEYYSPQGPAMSKEYYDLSLDPWQLRNVLGDGDAANDPWGIRTGELASQLAADRACAGPAACP